MKALLVIDVQEAIIQCKDFTNELNQIEQLIGHFKEKKLPVIFIRHIDPNSNFFKIEQESSMIYKPFQQSIEKVILKSKPSAFYQTELDAVLKQLGVDHLFITGFNAEFCCMFTAIAAYDRGYKVTFLEDAIGTVNDENSYEIKGLDVKELISTILHWSNVVQVIDHEELVEEYPELV